jgi:hypothetical protein
MRHHGLGNLETVLLAHIFDNLKGVVDVFVFLSIHETPTAGAPGRWLNLVSGSPSTWPTVGVSGKHRDAARVHFALVGNRAPPSGSIDNDTASSYRPSRELEVSSLKPPPPHPARARGASPACRRCSSRRTSCSATSPPTQDAKVSSHASPSS